MWTYAMYAASDTANEKMNLVRERFGFAGKDAYFLLRDGVVYMVQWDGQYPEQYGATLAEAAANHCAALNAAPEPESAPDPAQMEAALNELGVITRE